MYIQGGVSLKGCCTSARQARRKASRQIDADEQVIALETLEPGPPVPDPDKILCAGLNYAQHAAEAHMEVPAAPTLFTKFRNSLIGPTDSIILPRISPYIDYEGELAVVIGKRCKEVSEQEALTYVAGYAVANDVSARDLQIQTSQWMAGKTIDTFAPLRNPLVLPEENKQR